jgi:hypothetical protein
VDWVHVSVDRPGVLGPPWTDVVMAEGAPYPFIGAGGGPGRGGRELIADVNGFNVIEGVTAR